MMRTDRAAHSAGPGAERQPRYTMAQLLRKAIDSGAPLSLARIPMTPEEVAASYNEAEGLGATTARPTVQPWTTRGRRRASLCPSPLGALGVVEGAGAG
ncbi:MAG TPA: hypothetical protein VF060_02795 [Trebonia sp.]